MDGEQVQEIDVDLYLTKNEETVKINPATSSDSVLFSDNQTLTYKMDSLTGKVSSLETDLESKVSNSTFLSGLENIQTSIDDKIQDLKDKGADKLHTLVIDALPTDPDELQALKEKLAHNCFVYIKGGSEDNE